MCKKSLISTILSILGLSSKKMYLVVQSNIFGSSMSTTYSDKNPVGTG